MNVEGWGLYAEAELQPYEPLEGQLVALQLPPDARRARLPRSRAPGGHDHQDEATRVLREDVVLSEAMAMQEVERYTFRAPGQATVVLRGLQPAARDPPEGRAARSARRFDRMRFNDFILAQGLLPPRLLRKAVIEEFVPAQRVTGAVAPADR